MTGSGSHINWLRHPKADVRWLAWGKIVSVAHRPGDGVGIGTIEVCEFHIIGEERVGHWIFWRIRHWNLEGWIKLERRLPISTSSRYTWGLVRDVFCLKLLE